MKLLYSKKWIVLLFFLLLTGLYLHNMTRDVYSGDIGDLATTGCAWGVAHPSGYPLFTFLSNLLCRLPLNLPPVTKITLLSVAASLGALYFFYRFALRFTKSIFIGLLSTSILGLSYLFWVHAEIPEVFALNNFFTVAILYFATLFYEKKKLKYLYITAFLCGLSLSHHHTIVLIFPGVLLLVLKHWRLIFSQKARPAIISLLLAFAGLIPYVYVLVAASHNPPINWDTVTGLKNLLLLFLRTDYVVAPPLIDANTPIAVKLIQAGDLFKNLKLIFSYQIIFAAVVGFIYLLKKNFRLWASLLLSFILAGPFFIFYAANIITTVQAWAVVERFYTMPTVLFMFYVPFGFIAIKNLLNKILKNDLLCIVMLSYFVLVPVLMLKYTFPKTDLSKTQIGNTLAANILNSLPPQSLLFLSGDTTTFNTWYVHYILGKRKDVTIIQQPTVGGNYYMDEMINRYHKTHPDVPNRQLFDKTLTEVLKTRRVFATTTVNTLPSGFTWIPTGYLVEAFDNKKVPVKEAYLKTVEENLKKIRPQRRDTLTLAEENLTAVEIPLIYSNAFIRIADFIAATFQDYPVAEHYYRRALWIDPDNPEGYAGLSTVALRGYKDCRGAIENRKTAIELYPIWTLYYKQLYYIYSQCNIAQKDVKELESVYRQKFGSDINAKND